MTALALLLLVAGPATFPDKPDGEHNVVSDEADLITAADHQAINELAAALRVDKSAPIIVVTILSMAGHGARGYTIERYAHELFDAWGIGSREHNYGILLLVSKADRKARIEFGADWGRDHDDDARAIMQRLIIPRFKQGSFSEGILEGVRALDAVARGGVPPYPPRPWWEWMLWIGLPILAGGMGYSMHTRGIEGWGYGFLVFFCVTALTVVSAALGSGGGGGGSYGGGFSGGGGATGSW